MFQTIINVGFCIAIIAIILLSVFCRRICKAVDGCAKAMREQEDKYHHDRERLSQAPGNYILHTINTLSGKTFEVLAQYSGQLPTTKAVGFLAGWNRDIFVIVKRFKSEDNSEEEVGYAQRCAEELLDKLNETI